MKLKLYSYKLNCFFNPAAIFMIAGLLFTHLVNAQTPTYNKVGTGTLGNSIPLGSASSKTQLLYTPTDFNTLPINGNISKIYFRNSASAISNTYTNFQVSFIQNNDAAFLNTNYYVGLTPALNSASLTLTGNVIAPGWFEIVLPTPFPYDNTKTLIVEIQYSGRTGTTGLLTTTTTSTGNKRLSGAFNASIGSAQNTWNDFGMEVQPFVPCIDPPTAGTATATPPGPFCPGTLTTYFNLTGNSTGSGQTYQWFSDPSQFGTYSTSISGVSSMSSASTIPFTTLWYRCAVTCGATTSYSSPVQVVVNQPLAGGTYTIGPAGDFTTITNAINAMGCGIAGPVIFNVTTGTYTEQMIIPNINGTSAGNTITFNGNGSTLQFGPTVTSARAIVQLLGTDYTTIDNFNITATAGTYGWGVHLIGGADYNTISNCNIRVDSSNTSNVNFLGIVISGSTSSGTATGNNGNFNTITGNTISGGFNAIVLTGSTTAGSENLNNTVSNNIVRNSYANAIEFVGQKNLTVSTNDVSRPTRTNSSTIAGISLGLGCSNALIENNRIHNLFDAMLTSTSTCYGLFTSAVGTAANRNVFQNNLIYNINGNATLYGMYNSSGAYAKYYHNTISFDDGGSTSAGFTYGMYQLGAVAGLEYINNIVFITRGGTGAKRCIYFASTTTANISNNNAFYLNPPAGTNNHLGQYLTVTYTTLANWKTANSNLWDQQSVSANPGFVSPGTGDFTPTSNGVNNIGTNVGVTTDILNQLRSATTPDPGAYEFTVPPTDIGVLNIVSPNNSGCYTNAETIVVTVKNFGLTTIDFLFDPVTVTADVTGQITTSSSAILNSGTLAPGATQNVTLSPSIDATANGNYSINVYTTLASDGNNTNDALPQIDLTVGVTAGSIYPSLTYICASQVPPTLMLNGYYGGAIQWQESSVSSSGPWNNVGTNSATYIPPSLSQTTYYQAIVSCNTNSATTSVASITFNNPQLISAIDGSRCGIGSVTLGATVSGASTANWYTNASGGVPIATGTTFNTPNINSTTNYYVAASTGGFSANTGMTAALSTATSGSGTTNTGLVFDVYSAFTLNSVVVYPVSPSSSTGTVTIDIINSAGTVLHTASVSVTGHPISSIVPVTIPLNFTVAPGTNFKMRPGFIGVAGLLFEPSASAPGGNYGYPYTVPGVLSILTSTITAAPTNTARNDLYNYFYNWNITTGCESARTLVTATVTPSPDLDVTTTFGAICTGGSTDIAASSVNDPDYTYSWTSSPAGFTATGAGPHTVSPTVTTKYYVYASDNSGNANQGCAAIDSITVVSGGTLASGTVSANISEHCVSGSSTLTVTGASGGFLQWQKSTVSATGPWTNVGTGTTTLATGVLTQTTYYQVEVSCQTSSLTSNVKTITVTNPQITSSNGDSRCGPGTVTLTATAATGTINWYAAPTGGTPLASGTSYTQNVTGTTIFYTSATISGVGTSGLGLPNRVGSTFNSGYNDVGLMFDAIQSFTLQSVAVYPIATSPSGNVNAVIALKNSAGTILQSQSISIPTAVAPGVKTVVGLNFTVPAGSGYRLVFTSASGGGVTGFIRETSGFSYPYTLPGTASITSAYTAGPSASYYYYFYDWQIVSSCEGNRIPVVANVSTPPSITVSSTQSTCSNESKTLTVSSPNDPDYTYTWTPGNLSGASVIVNPSSTTTYTVNAVDNTAGPNAGCTNIGSVLVNVLPAPSTPVIIPASAQVCGEDTVKLKVIMAHTGTLGIQASQNTPSTYPAPYTMPYGGQRMQMLVTASELNASGYSAGSQISAIQFPVISMGSNWGSVVTSCQNFKVSIGATSLTSISTFQSGLTQVVAPANFTPTVGYNNTHNFSSSFTWDGISNIIIETTFSNFTAGNTNNNVIQYNSPTSYQSTIVYRQDNVTAAAAAVATAVSATFNSRVDFKLIGTSGGPVSWSPLTDLYTDENLTTPYTGGIADSVYSNPSTSMTYSVNSTFGGCTSSSTVTVTVDTVPQVSITAAGSTTYCPGSTVTLNASTDPTYTNYAWTPAGPSGPGATSFTVGGATNSTTIYTVTATGAGGCTSHETIPVTVYDTVSPDITVIGNANLCSGQTTSDLQGDIFGPTGPAQNYTWSTSETTQLITISTSGTYSLVTTDANGCITHNTQVITESTAPTAPIVTPAGPINLCSFDGGNTYNAATLTVTNYSSDLQWSTSETTTSIIVDYPDNFFAIYTDPSGCYSVSNTVTTFTNLASDAATGATSDASFNAICLGNTVTLTVDGGFLGDGADWHWYEGSCIGGTPRGTGSSVTLTPTTGGLHTYYVRAEGICNTTTCASISIQVSTAPPPYGASITTYPVSGCNGTTAVMSGPVVSGASFYNWSCAQGGVLFNGSPGPLQTATPTVTVTFVSPPPAGASGYSICVFAGNGCGQSLTFCRFIRARVSQPSAISGSIIACANTNSIYSVGAVAGADSYTWTVTGSATINGGTNTITTASNSVTVNFLPGWSTGTLSVYSSLSCGFNSAARSLAISSTPAVPGIMSGPGYVCAGSSASFNVPAVNGAASYNWTTSVPGAVISPSSNSASILFPAVIPAGSTVCVTAVSSCGNASAARCKSIANGIPNIPGNISGPVSGQCAQSGVSYSVIPVAQATAYLWTATGGASVSGPNNLSAVSINFPSGFVTCTLSVVAQNSCGSSAARTLIVNGAPAQPGTITGSQSVCNGAVEPYSTTGSTGATSYGWAVPVGATILNTPPYGSSILVMWGATGGNVTVNATNDCGSSTMRTLSVAVTCREAQVSEALKSTATLYPNPTGGKTTLQFDSKANVKYALQVLDVTGRMILSENISAVEGSNMHELDFTTIAKGMYLIRLESSDAELQLLKLTVE